MPDLILRAGVVLDGSGAPPRTADIAIRDGHIAEVGRVRDRAHRVIDVDGALVFAGLGALLPPADVAPFDRNRQHHRAPGVTTTIELAEASACAASELPRYLRHLEDQRFVTNRAFLFDHDRIRREVLGNKVRDHLSASEGDSETMADLLQDAIEAGVVGVRSSPDVDAEELRRLLNSERIHSELPSVLLDPGTDDDLTREVATRLVHDCDSLRFIASVGDPLEHERITSAIASFDDDQRPAELFGTKNTIAGTGLNPLGLLRFVDGEVLSLPELSQRWADGLGVFGLPGPIHSDRPADLNVVDRPSLNDDLSTGVVSTIVNGEEIVSFDELTGAAPGRLVRSQPNVAE